VKASEFIAAYKGLPAWENAAFELAREGAVVDWPMVPVQLRTPDGAHEGTVRVASDLFAVGTPDDFLRLPLTPGAAQRIANLGGLLLPTPLLARRIWEQADVKLTPIQSGSLPAYKENKGAFMPQYAAHDVAIEAQRAGRTGLVTGHKKDIVVSKLLKPGKVIIYGWFRSDKPLTKESMDPSANPIQPRSDAHGDFYVDYSHGVRFVSPFMTVDGKSMLTEDVMRDPELSALVSDEGPLKTVRYAAPNAPAKVYPHTPSEPQASRDDVFYRPGHGSLADQGLAVLLRRM
jgi:hypothetical protein